MSRHWSKTSLRVGASLVTLLGALAVSGAAPAQTAVTPLGTQYFGLVGLATGQTVRLNIHMGEPDDPSAAPGECHVKMTIFGGDGSVLKAAEGAVEEGKNSSIVFRRTARLAGLLLVRAEIEVSPTAGPAPPSCKSISTMELVDTANGRTSLVEIANPEW